jgi:hypothetical protein
MIVILIVLVVEIYFVIMRKVIKIVPLVTNISRATATVTKERKKVINKTSQLKKMETYLLVPIPAVHQIVTK